MANHDIYDICKQAGIPLSSKHDEIYELVIKKGKRKLWLHINGSVAYDLNDWKIQEAIEDFLSKEGYERRMVAFYTAWGFYD